MPVYGEENAPIFDHTRPSSLRQYFAQLETHFTRCAMESDVEKKTFAISFPVIDVAETWEALPEFSDDTTTYLSFKAQLFYIYSQDFSRFSISDLERLVLDTKQRGIQSLLELSPYYLEFNKISSYLIDLGLLSTREQSIMFIQAFDTSLAAKIDLRLQIQSPARFIYPLAAIFEAAQWILRAPAHFAIPTSPVRSPANSIATRPLQLATDSSAPISANSTSSLCVSTKSSLSSVPETRPSSIPAPITTAQTRVDTAGVELRSLPAQLTVSSNFAAISPETTSLHVNKKATTSTATATSTAFTATTTALTATTTTTSTPATAITATSTTATSTSTATPSDFTPISTNTTIARPASTFLIQLPSTPSILPEAPTDSTNSTPTAQISTSQPAQPRHASISTPKDAHSPSSTSYPLLPSNATRLMRILVRKHSGLKFADQNCEIALSFIDFCGNCHFSASHATKQLPFI